MKQEHSLIRGLGPLGSASMVVGTIIGTGIFLVPSTIAMEVKSVGLVFLVWVVAGLLSLAGALSYAELGAALPEAGGEYVYLRRAYGPLWGFLYGWEQFVIGKTGSVASLAAAFTVFLSFFFKPLQEDFVQLSLGSFGWSLTGGQLVAIAAIASLTLINYFGVVVGGAVQTVLTVMKVAVVLTLAALALAIGGGDWSHFSSFSQSSAQGVAVSAFGLALLSAFWAYDGWNNLAMVGGEVRDPERNIPRALIYGTGGVMLVYLLVNVAYFYILPLEDVAGPTGKVQVAQVMARSFLGEWGAILITLGALISTYATLNAAILSGARVPYAMARDRLFFRHMADVHPVHRAPAKALLLQAAIACLLVLIFQGDFDRLIRYTLFGLWIFYGMTTASVFVLRRKDPTLPRPYRTLGYPWVPGIFVVMATVICLNTLYSTPKEAGLGLLFLAAGLPFYWFWQRRAR
ncbi:MAG: APC family permease [Terriglobia bacterium]